MWRFVWSLVLSTLTARGPTLEVRLCLRAYLAFKPSWCIKASFYIPENDFIFQKLGNFVRKIAVKLLYRYIAI